MNVALLHYSALPIVGGVEIVMDHQARLLAGAGHAVRLVAGRGEAQPGGAPLVRLPLLDSRHARVLAAKAELDQGRLPADFEGLSAEIETGLLAALAGSDIVIAHNVCSLHKNLPLTAALSRLNGRPGFPRLILWQHDLAWTAAQYQAELHDGYPWDLLRQDWPGARQVVVSEARRQQLARLLGLPIERIVVVPNGVDAHRLLKLGEQARRLAAELRLDEAQPLLLLPVRLTARKNIELALRVLAALRDWPDGGQLSFRSAALLVTGPQGPHNPANAEYRRRLLALRDELGLEGAAHFAIELVDHPLPEETVADLYRLADALILPSREEGFGLPLLEAGLARLPVLCADIAPLRELGAGDATYFSPDAEPGAVARLVVDRLTADPAYRFSARVRRQYAWPRVYAERIEPLLQQ
jgi:glycosyltransferase involved in cell wall biosynthesis